MKGPTTPLEILANNPTEEETAKVHALMVGYSVKFGQFGDPRTWEDRNLVMGDVQDFAWLSGTNRMIMVANYDEWITGAWNDIDGVVKPADRR